LRPFARSFVSCGKTKSLSSLKPRNSSIAAMVLDWLADKHDHQPAAIGKAVLKALD
jgi:hypothetical protein